MAQRFYHVRRQIGDPRQLGFRLSTRGARQLLRLNRCIPFLYLDLIRYSFGVQEYSPLNLRTQTIFRGCPTMKDGYLRDNTSLAGISM
jgi:hypothetical protein